MATPSGNSPSSPASTEGRARNIKRMLECNPPTYAKYLKLRHGFLNSHAYMCHICKSFTYGSGDGPQLNRAYDSNFNLTETQVEDMILGHLDVIYRNAIKDLTSIYGYPEANATSAVLATGICYGCKDPIGNALKHALTFLKCGLRVHKSDQKQNFSKEMKTLVKLVSMIVYDGQKKNYPFLCKDDFLLWLLIYKIDPSNVLKPASFLFRGLAKLQNLSSSTSLQRKGESTANTSTVQFMPEAGVTEDDKLEASSPHSEKASVPELTPATGDPGLASGRFAAATSLSLSNFDPNAAKRKPMSSSDSPLDKFSSLTISESSIPEEKPAYANSKHADSSRRDFTLRCTPERRHQARLIGKAEKLVTLTNQILESTRSSMLDSYCSLPKLDKTVGLESSQSFASSSFIMSTVTTTSSLSHAANADAFTPMPSKSSSDASFKPDYDVASCIPYVLEMLLSRGPDLQVELQYWTNWAHRKVMQATNRLNKDKAELQTLRQEKLEAIKRKEAFTERTMKKIGEMDTALSRAKTMVQVASAAICKLELEKARLEQELEAAKIRASESAANSQEASLKEIETLKKAQTCERERTLFQEELLTEKRVLSQLQRQLQQALVSHGQIEARWKQEERLKSEELTKVLNERKKHEKLEASVKSKEDMIQLKNESNMQSCIDDIRRLRHETAELKLMINSSNFARLDWAQSAYFPTDVTGFKESGTGEVQRDWECVMCLAEEISVVFLPCAHQVLCTKCNELHKNRGLGDCPSCRTPIKQRICVRSAYNI